MTDAASAGPRAVLARTGEVGRALLDVDWSATRLGPPEDWPQSLATAVQLMLQSRFAMWMAWGEDLTFFCNEAYRQDTLGTKYPRALGRPASEVWSEIWPDVVDRVEAVVGRGESTWDEGLMLFLERSGFVEETYHTFSYSPIAGDDGSVQGLLCVVSEDTTRVIGTRRMTTLRDLGSDLAAVRTEAELLTAACARLADNQADLPFALTYLLGPDGSACHLACASGMEAGHPAAPETMAVHQDATWPLAGLEEPLLVADLADRFESLPTGAWDVPPEQALVVPLASQGTGAAYGVLIVGLNPHRPVDAEYRDFVGLVAGQFAAGLASARSYEAERLRAEQLAEVDRAKTQFFTNVSHELRTPLTLLVGPAEDALADTGEPLAPAQRRRVEVIARNGERLLKLVNTLLDFSRLEAGGADAQFEPLDLARHTAEMASMFQSAVDRAGLTLTIECPPLPEPVHVDREMWAKIVLNLVSNALKFTFEGGITVRVQAVGDVARLTVADTGIGVDEAHRARLFERFHRVPDARSRTHEGSGIGLALVAELVALHGGSVAVASTPGEGTTFTVEVPFGTAHLDQAALTPAPGADDARVTLQARGFVNEAMRWLQPEAAPAAAADPDDGRARILIADDNADMRAYMSELLAEEYAVQTAPDGRVALELARADPPDLVLTDVMMPGLDGFGLLAALNADPATMQVPVVMVSARAGEDGTIEGLEAGADDYLVKPFAARELLARVKSNLELDRARRVAERLRHTQRLVDQAQRLAGVGSYEVDLATGSIVASVELMRQLHLSREQLEVNGLERALTERLHPEDLPHVTAALEHAMQTGEPIDYEARVVSPGGAVRTYRTLGVIEHGPDGEPARLSGSNQDITEQREAERVMAAATAEREAAARERAIADELQRSLLPELVVDVDFLEVATYYQAGAEGTQVGGDWYDVIEIGPGRTALVVGDVMGRGVRAAAIMGQLRAAVRAYARLDLPPADVLESLDGAVRDLDAEHIATCVYAVFDANQGTLAYANAGHLPPLLRLDGEAPQRLDAAAGPPLGSGPFALGEDTVALPAGSLLTLYTDGLVERRDRPLDVGIDALGTHLVSASATTGDVPQQLVRALVPDGSDDDIAVLVARVPPLERGATTTLAIDAEASAIPRARAFAAESLGDLPDPVPDDALLLVSEMVTNAILHGQPPIRLHVQRRDAQVLIEVEDQATAIPRKRRPGPHDEHGRGLQLVDAIANEWGIRPTPRGKAVWCLLGPAA